MYLLLRILAAVFMIFLIAFGQWWLLLIAAIIFLFVYNAYYEIIVWGITVDALYGLPPGISPRIFHLFNMSYFATLLAVVLFFIGIFLKKRLSFYS